MKTKNLLLITALIATLTSCGGNTSSQKTSHGLSEISDQNPSSQNASQSTSQTSVATSSAIQEITVTDMINRQITVKPGSYKKVVCIGAGALRLYSYIGDCSLLAGVEDIDNESLQNRPKMFDGAARPYVIANSEIFKKLPTCGVGGPNAQAAEAEKILACDPDIIVSEYEDVDKANALQEEVGVPVVTLKLGSQGVFDSVTQDTLTLLGKVFNKEARALELNTYINSEKNAIAERVKDVNINEGPKTYICGLGNWGTTNHLMTSKYYPSFNIAKIQNALVNVEANKGVFAIEKETFESIGANIDIMIIDAAAVKNIKPQYQNDNTIFASTKAWNDGEVYLQMPFNAYYTNLEIALANTWYNAKVVYPSLFEDINMVEKTNEVTLKFNGKQLATEIFAKPNSFGGYQKINTQTFFN